MERVAQLVCTCAHVGARVLLLQSGLITDRPASLWVADSAGAPHRRKFSSPPADAPCFRSQSQGYIRCFPGLVYMGCESRVLPYLVSVTAICSCGWPFVYRFTYKWLRGVFRCVYW